MPDPPANDPAISELKSLYERADKALASLGPTCLGGGACCRFDLAGHRLYVSLLEARLLLQAPAQPEGHRTAVGRCPYQRGPRCLAREVRPLGCRTYFCRGDTQRLQRLHERFHRRIGRLHADHDLPYRYGELTHVLAEMPVGLGREVPDLSPPPDKLQSSVENCVDSPFAGP
jgi:Fe-S-cluster containining protein